MIDKKNLIKKINAASVINRQAFYKSILPTVFFQGVFSLSSGDCFCDKNSDDVKVLTSVDEYLITGLKSKEGVVSGSFKLSRFGILWCDFCAGLYRYLTTCIDLSCCQFLYNKDNIPSVLRLVITKIDLVKCCFGCCVDDSGSFVYGLSTVLKKRSYRDFINILNKKIPEPVLYVSDMSNRVIGFDTPVHIKAKNNNDEFIIEVDLRYFSLKLDKNNHFLSNGRYIPSICGLYSLCLVGVNDCRRSGMVVPSAINVYRFIFAIQAVAKGQSNKHIKINNLQYSDVVMFDAAAIQDIFSCSRYVRGCKYIDYKKAVNFLIGACYSFISGLYLVCGCAKIARRRFDFFALPDVTLEKLNIEFVDGWVNIPLIGARYGV